MKAAVYVAPHKVVVREEPDPLPAAGEAVVAVEAVGICGSDMHAYHGFDSRRPPPLILGHEAAGRIVDGPRAGERVAINPLVIDPECPSARDGLPHLSPTRQILSIAPRSGAFAEYVRVPERNLLPIPDRLSTRQAALAEPIAVAWHGIRLGLERLRRPLAASSVVVLGAGAVGLPSALLARHFGAADVRIGDMNPLRRANAERTSGIKTYAPDASDRPADNSVDLVVDAVGAAQTRADACRMIRPGGVIVHIGLLPGSDGLDIRKITLQEITFTGSYCYTPEDFAQTLAAMASGALGPLDWFEERPLAEAQQAFEDIDRGAVAAPKILLRP
ncbi:MAG: zinc-binding dehydrogenase [Alphaproteobacteria bacterium]|nr:zinc-binding dehydrogenase [Alphaproteobacteria bacterium]